MRILVVSDTHGDERTLSRVLLAQATAEVVIHLGDGEAEAARMKAQFPEKMFLGVRGNCDWGSALPVFGEFVAQGVPIFYTHGHFYNVKFGLREAEEAARDRDAQVLLYGHTHRAFESYEEGLYILNPGSLSGYDASYGTVDVTPAGIVTNVVKVL